MGAGHGWGWSKKLWFIVFDSDGTVLLEPTVAYNYKDEDPEQISNPDAVVDSLGNLYVIFNQIENTPIFGGYPTFGWFTVDSLGIEEEESPEPGAGLISITPSCNPFCGDVEFLIAGGSVSELSVYDITGRVVSVVSVSGDTGYWDGRDLSGERLPSGVYTVSGGENCMPTVITLLDD